MCEKVVLTLRVRERLPQSMTMVVIARVCYVSRRYLTRSVRTTNGDLLKNVYKKNSDTH